MTCVRTTRGASLCTAAAVPMAAGSLALLFAAPAFASSLGGIATIAHPGTTAATSLTSGGSTTEFTVALPANAACSDDTATDGYHVYSYLVKKGTDLSGVSFINSPSVGYGFVDTTGTYYGAVNTATKTGQIIGIPNDFEWGPLVTSDGGSVPLSRLLYSGTAGVWEAGVACADTHGKLSNDWNTEVTFTASTKDPTGFTWSSAPVAASSKGGTGAASTTATGATSTTTTTAGGVVAGGTSSSNDRTGSLGTSTNGSSASAGRVPGTPGAETPQGSPVGSDLPVIGIVAVVLLAAGTGFLVLRRSDKRRTGTTRSTRERAQ